MHLKVIVEEQTVTLKLEPSFLSEAEPFFKKMDADMDQGWQMGRDWVERPDNMQKATIAADKLLTAIENNEEKLGLMMAGYITSRLSGIQSIEMDITGEMGHHFEFEQQQPAQPEIAIAQGKLNKMQALEQAGKEVSKVFKQGKQYRFSMFNPQTGQWEESPAMGDKQEAENLRDFAFKKRFDELTSDGVN